MTVTVGPSLVREGTIKMRADGSVEVCGFYVTGGGLSYLRAVAETRILRAGDAIRIEQQKREARR